MDLNDIGAAAASCTNCDLHIGRIKPVFAKGNPNANIMVCGMVPAKEENEVGIPFVGRAGKFLDGVLEAAGLSLDDVYVTNLVKCFLAAGKPLKTDWINNCFPYIVAQIDAIHPEVIVTLGGDASKTLIGADKNTAVGALVGKVFQYSKQTKIMPTYHPSYLLRTGGQKSSKFGDVLNTFKLCKILL
jgi:DNA polymerase